MVTDMIKVVLDEGAYMPERAHEADAGYDLRTPEKITLPANDSIIVDTGVHIEIPKGFVGILKSKSGLNINYGITGTGTIDSGYTGSIRVKLYNNHYEPHTFHKGDKLIQLVLLPIITPELIKVDTLEDTERGSDGFGSTGR
jgi:dUTP pyrophosphatase